MKAKRILLPVAIVIVVVVVAVMWFLLRGESNTTDEAGRIVFVDEDTMEQVEITVVDAVTGGALEGIEVQWDHGEGFEVFVCVDRSRKYFPQIEFYSHNSSHVFKMEPVGDRTYVVERIEDEDGIRIIQKWISQKGMRHVSQRTYVRTISGEEYAQIGKRAWGYSMFILDRLTGGAGKLVTILKTAGKHVATDVLERELEEVVAQAQRWDEYESSVTSSVTGTFYLPSNIPEIRDLRSKREGDTLRVGWEVRDRLRYPDGTEDATVFLGPTEKSDLTHKWRLLDSDDKSIRDWQAVESKKIVAPNLAEVDQCVLALIDLPDAAETIEVSATDEVGNVAAQVLVLVGAPVPASAKLSQEQVREAERRASSLVQDLRSVIREVCRADYISVSQRERIVSDVSELGELPQAALPVIERALEDSRRNAPGASAKGPSKDEWMFQEYLSTASGRIRAQTEAEVLQNEGPPIVPAGVGGVKRQVGRALRVFLLERNAFELLDIAEIDVAHVGRSGHGWLGPDIVLRTREGTTVKWGRSDLYRDIDAAWALAPLCSDERKLTVLRNAVHEYPGLRGVEYIDLRFNKVFLGAQAAEESNPELDTLVDDALEADPARVAAYVEVAGKKEEKRLEGIPIQVLAPPQFPYVAEVEEPTVTVVVSGLAQDLGRVKPDMLTVYVDLRALQDVQIEPGGSGPYKVEVHLVLPDGIPLDFERVEPDEVTVILKNPAM